MYPFQRILCPTDFSLCAEVALKQAMHLARCYRAELVLLHVAAPTPTSGWRIPVDASSIDTLMDKALKKGAYGHEESSYFHDTPIRRTVLHHADRVTALLDYVRTEAVDLIVMGTHGDRTADCFLRRGGDLLLGSTAAQMVRHAPCPVFTVGLSRNRAPEQLHRILVPMDRSSLSMLALSYARDLAGRHDGHIDVLHVIEGHDPRGTETSAEAQAERADLSELYEQTTGATVSAGFHVVTGRPDKEIRQFARQHGVDLIVQGAHSYPLQAPLGKVAEEIIRSALCPVLTVRGAEERVTL